MLAQHAANREVVGMLRIETAPTHCTDKIDPPRARHSLSPTFRQSDIESWKLDYSRGASD